MERTYTKKIPEGTLLGIGNIFSKMKFEKLHLIELFLCKKLNWEIPLEKPFLCKMLSQIVLLPLKNPLELFILPQISHLKKSK